MKTSTLADDGKTLAGSNIDFELVSAHESGCALTVPKRSHEQGEALMKGIFTALVLAALMAEASAQSTTRSFYDASGRSTGQAATSGNTTTFYGSSGRTTGPRRHERQHDHDLRRFRPLPRLVHDEPLKGPSEMTTDERSVDRLLSELSMIRTKVPA